MCFITVECPHCGKKREVKATSLQARSWEVPMCRSCTTTVYYAKKRITDPELMEAIEVPCGASMVRADGRCDGYLECRYQSFCVGEAGKRHWERWKCIEKK